LFITTGQLTVENGGLISTSTLGEGDGGTLTINAADFATISGSDGLFLSTLSTSAGADSTGKAGDLIITTGQLTVEDSAIVSSQTLGSGNAGNLTISANQLQVQGGGKILTSTTGQGDGGTLTIDAPNSVIVSGTNGASPSLLSTSAEAGSSGDAGGLFITTGQLTVENGGLISTSTFGEGDGGTLTINAADFATISGSNDGISSALLASAEAGSSGNAGELSITTDQLTVSDGAIVSTQTSGSGNAGALFITTDQLTVQNGALITTQTQASGNASELTITTGQLNIQGGGQISASTTGTGNGGKLTINASDSATLAGTDGKVASGVFTTAGPDSSGEAGELTLLVNGPLTVQDGAQISSQSEGSGNAGNIALQTTALSLNNGSVTASATQSGGGDITITAPDVQLTNNSLISTSVQNSTGGGGNIQIQSDTFNAFQNSDILATANQGPGGNITIDANIFFADTFANGGPTPSNVTDFDTLRNNGRVDISASSGAPNLSGQVSVPDVSFLQNSLQELGANFISPEQIVSGSCLARQQAAAEGSSFIVKSSESPALSPYELSPLGYQATAIEPTQNAATEKQQTRQGANPEPTQTNTQPTWKLGDPIQEANNLVVSADGRILLGSTQQMANLKEASDLICR
jgi:large exoprotein involved in heme utilization and adhesion